MKITIDTKEDSKEEIRRAIQLLSGLVGESGVGVKKDLFSSGSESSGNAFASMFGSGEEEKKEETPIDLSILNSSKEEKEDDEEVPGVISY